MAFLLRCGRRSRGIHRLFSSIYTPSYNRPLQFIDLCGASNPEHGGNSWQRWVSADNRNGLILWSVGNARLYSESAKQKENGRVLEDFKHQEIEGPTVERDMSILANEVREEDKKLRKRMHDLSRGLLLLGVAQLSCGAWLHWVMKVSPFSEVSIQSFFAFAFPFTFAYIVRQALKSMTFFTKMEEQGRLQILTLMLQVTKGMSALFQRVNSVVILCAAGISMGLLANQWLSSGST